MQTTVDNRFGAYKIRPRCLGMHTRRGLHYPATQISLFGLVKKINSHTLWDEFRML